MAQLKVQGNASGTGVFTVTSPNSNNTQTLTLPDGTGTLVASGVNSAITTGTAVASTSGTSIDFTSIPSWVRRITVMFNGVSTNGTSAVQVQLGTSGGVQTSGYNGSVTAANLTTGFKVENSGAAAYIRNGAITISSFGSNIWAGTINMGLSDQVGTFSGGGAVTLSGTLDRVRITTVNGTDTFDAGSINILYE